MMALTYTADAFDATRYIEQNLSPAELERAFGKWCQDQTDIVDALNAELAGVVIPKTLAVDDEAVSRFTRVPLTSTATVTWASDFEVVDWIWEKVRALSPVLRGTYKATHLLFADGVEMTAPDPSVRADEWIIVSPVAYARKIEGNAAGASSGGYRKPQSPQAPNGVYSVAAVLAAQQFKNVSIKFTFVQLASAGSVPPKKSLITWAAKKHGNAARFASTTSARARIHRFMKAARNPAIVIRFR